MATEKKTATAKPVAKAVVAKVEEKKAEAPVVKAEAPAEKKEAAKKAPAKKETAKKAPAKKEAAKKAPAKKEAAKKAPAEKKAPAKKAAAKKEVVYVQFAGKSYSYDELVKIAQDVWVYDMGKKVADMKSVEIYVKPEESKAYFVVNGTENGEFAI